MVTLSYFTPRIFLIRIIRIPLATKFLNARETRLCCIIRSVMQIHAHLVLNAYDNRKIRVNCILHILLKSVPGKNILHFQHIDYLSLLFLNVTGIPCYQYYLQTQDFAVDRRFPRDYIELFGCLITPKKTPKNSTNYIFLGCHA